VGVFAGPEVVEDGLVLCLDAGNPKSYPGSGTTWTIYNRALTASEIQQNFNALRGRFGI
jgi:hypothetical protein